MEKIPSPLSHLLNSDADFHRGRKAKRTPQREVREIVRGDPPLEKMTGLESP